MSDITKAILASLIGIMPSNLEAGLIEVPKIPHGQIAIKAENSQTLEYTQDGEKYRIIDIGKDGNIDLVEKYRTFMLGDSTYAISDSTGFYVKTGTIYQGSRGYPVVGIDKNGNHILGPEKKEIIKEDVEGNKRDGNLIDQGLWDFLQKLYEQVYPKKGKKDPIHAPNKCYTKNPENKSTRLIGNA